ncbi:alpha/beta hydrolase [Paractinoplanes ferrugineus]|uniref:Hydrolase n=1 Tax=Paractinoplanes ferrugineus TaxID=113564 RepID=A0A919IWY9_9ACTN|nr:alpha/beta hydrolase [Actinoplanes ferrugineus]GIE10420.1 hydrolase [Actinoplanes ferrugineus]
MLLRRLLAAAVTATIGAVTTTAGAGLLAPSPAGASPPVPPVAWADCRDGFECTTVPAPLDYDRPHGTQIALALLRLPATDPAHRIGSLLINPGGPGGSGVDFVRAYATYLPADVRARFDIVGFDPRGIHASTPLLCFDSYADAVASLPPMPFPQTTGEEWQQRAADDKLAAACARHGGAIRDHMSSADAARDMDLLRRVLGDKKLSYLGYSYGSLLGQNYANMFPGNFRALVIDGVVDPTRWVGSGSGDVPLGTRIGSADGARATLGEFFRLCDAAGPNCAFSGGAADRYAALAAKLREHPVPVIDPTTGEASTLTYNALIAGTLGSLYTAVSWPDLAAVLASVQDQTSPAELGRRLARLRSQLGVPDYPNDVEGSPGVACSDTVNPRSFGVWQRAADRAEQQYGYFGRVWNWTWSACRAWPASAGQDRYLGPWTTRTAAPVLVVGNYFDPATRYQGAVAAAHLLPNSRLLSYAGWGHAAYFIAFNPCVNDRVGEYLITGRPPAPGTVCQPVGSPFDAPAPAASAAPAGTAGVFLPTAVREALRAD